MQNSPLLGHSIAPPGEGPGGHRVKARETRPPRGSRPRATQSAISLQARFERPRKVTKSAGYPTTGPAIWPGRQYTNLPRISQAELLSTRRALQMRAPTHHEDAWNHRNCRVIGSGTES